MDKRTIEILDEKYNDVKNHQRDFIDSYKQALHDFLKENHLDGDVIKVIDGKERRGILQINSNGILGPQACHVNFYPYKKDGTISAKYRADYYCVVVPSDTFASILKIYKPAE